MAVYAFDSVVARTRCHSPELLLFRRPPLPCDGSKRRGAATGSAGSEGGDRAPSGSEAGGRSPSGSE